MIPLQLAVSLAASCGTISGAVRVDDSTTRFTYTAPSTLGTCTVTATRASDGKQATASYTITPPSIVQRSPAYGWQAGSTDPGVPFTLTTVAVSPASLASTISAVRATGKSIMLPIPCGTHDNCMTNGVYDPAKFVQRLDAFATSAGKQTVAAGVADGTVIGANLFDEPYTCGGANGGGNTWGPCGTLTKARIDSVCALMRQRFPTLPLGVEAQHQLFEPTLNYRCVDFTVDQYKMAFGNVTTWRDAGLAIGNRQHTQTLFSINVLDGGVQDKDGTYDCAGSGQAGVGTFGVNCRTTSADLLTNGRVLYPSGCGAIMWKYDATFAGRADNQGTFKALADTLARLPRKDCRRW